MNNKKLQLPFLILIVCILCMSVLLLIGYQTEKPAIETAEFPFSVTYEYQGKTETFSGTYICKAHYGTKHFREPNLYWSCYVKGYDVSSSFVTIHETENSALALCFPYDAAYLMGDSRYTSGSNGEHVAPYGEYFEYSEYSEIHITDPAELEQLGFRIIDWTDIEPITNSFHPGGIMLSGETSIYLAIIMLLGLIVCILFVKKENEVHYTTLDKLSVALNFLVGLVFFPFITIVAILSDIVAGGSLLDMTMYCLPSITLLGIGVSLVVRRKGHRIPGLLTQFIGPLVLALLMVLDTNFYL